MRCESTREQLHRLTDGEQPASWRLLPALTGHLLTCRECRAVWSRLARLRRDARRLPTLRPPGALRSRVLGSLPPVAFDGVPAMKKGRRTVVTRLIGGMALTVGLTLALLTLHGKRNASIAAEEVRAALAKVNTWHLRGWKLQEGKRTSWEIWGRRKPFFYREQVGGKITQDDGTQRSQVIPIVTWNGGHPGGLVMLSDSRPGPENMGWTFTTAFQNWHGYKSPAHQNSEEFTYAIATSTWMSDPPVERNEMLTVDRSTQLPMRYEVEIAEGARVPDGIGIFDTSGKIRKFVRHTTTEALQAEYDRPLPENFNAPPTPPGYQVVDARKGAPPANLPRDSMATKAGLSVQATPIALDAEGDVLIRFRGWLGDIPLQSRSDIRLHISEQEKWVKYHFADDMPYVDDQNRRYLRVDGTRVSPYQYGDSLYMIFSPLDPPTGPQNLPRTLTLTLSAAPTVTITEEGSPNHYKDQDLLNEDFTWTLTLPTKPTPIDPEKVVSRAELRKMGIIDEQEQIPLAVSVDDTRASYYLGRQSKTDATRKADTRLCLHWSEQALAAAKPGSNAAILAKANVAYRSHDLGDNVRAVRLLHEYLEESKRFPREFRDVRADAEKCLHDWSK